MLKILGRNNSSNVQKVLWALGELGVVNAVGRGTSWGAGAPD